MELSRKDKKTKVFYYMKMIIIIGLGNEGKKYVYHRHNVGFMVLDACAEKYGFSFLTKDIFSAYVGYSDETIFAKPTTFMNASGLAAKALYRQYEALPVIVHDDIDIPLGEVRCSFDRGAGGHNGVQSIVDHLGRKDFFRIRVGVRPVDQELLVRILPPKGFEHFLLSDFLSSEHELLKKGIEKSLTIIESLKTKSFDEIMNMYN